jgi:hypothetical protein
MIENICSTGHWSHCIACICCEMFYLEVKPFLNLKSRLIGILIKIDWLMVPVLLGMWVLLVTTTKILAVKAGTSLDQACLPCFVSTSALVKWSFCELKCLEQFTFLDIYALAPWGQFEAQKLKFIIKSMIEIWSHFICCLILT